MKFQLLLLYINCCFNGFSNHATKKLIDSNKGLFETKREIKIDNRSRIIRINPYHFRRFCICCSSNNESLFYNSLLILPILYLGYFIIVYQSISKCICKYPAFCLFFKDGCNSIVNVIIVTFGIELASKCLFTICAGV